MLESRSKIELGLLNTPVHFYLLWINISRYLLLYELILNDDLRIDQRSNYSPLATLFALYLVNSWTLLFWKLIYHSASFTKTHPFANCIIAVDFSANSTAPTLRAGVKHGHRILSGIHDTLWYPTRKPRGPTYRLDRVRGPEHPDAYNAFSH